MYKYLIYKGSSQYGYRRDGAVSHPRRPLRNYSAARRQSRRVAVDGLKKKTTCPVGALYMCRIVGRLQLLNFGPRRKDFR
jgi:hypothetical protein